LLLRRPELPNRKEGGRAVEEKAPTTAALTVRRARSCRRRAEQQKWLLIRIMTLRRNFPFSSAVKGNCQGSRKKE
jgi:hypothetical protein